MHRAQLELAEAALELRHLDAVSAEIDSEDLLM